MVQIKLLIICQFSIPDGLLIHSKTCIDCISVNNISALQLLPEIFYSLLDLSFCCYLEGLF